MMPSFFRPVLSHTLRRAVVLRQGLSNNTVARTQLFRAAFSQTAVKATPSTTVIQETSKSAYKTERDPNFKELSEQDLAFFKSVLPPSSIVQDEDNLSNYNIDWLKRYQGHSKLVLKPSTTEQVSKLLKYCSDNRIAVVPQGGNTGVVGGGTPVFDEVIISTSNMNNIRSFDAISGSLVCDAGCILENLDNFLAENGHIMPLDLGAKGRQVCQIGGNVSTNAGGLRYLRYGSLHGNVLGLEVVLPDGTILNNMSTLRKDNTGYDLKQLFIGAEGTLGIVTGVSIASPKRPKAVNLALLGVDSFDQVIATFKRSKDELCEIVSAFEFWDQASINLVQKHLAVGSNIPLQSSHQFYVLVETSGSNKEHDDEKLGQLLEGLITDGIIQDGVLAQDTTQIRNLWAIREGIPEACSKAGAVYMYDISMPVSVLYKLVEDLKTRFQEKGVFGEGKLIKSVTGFGHMGDGNLHLNVEADAFTPEATGLIEPFIYEWTAENSGSISAEHGLGRMKNQYLHYTKAPEMIDLMRRLKVVFDPKGIMNPYKFFPSS
ncbi:hypothetical protein BGW38_010408 [Lunasporangiospora selenospora]|uniref:D-lactate dehydrogenase (cytochrome) n=1 Tax=Lunasporangiospora selenospora TaxID=979761 RepID=A0A9P6KHS2_9FUNG|nr:hypothetical protein BGW38_010408 [Lunasporangiospora selenospora]